MNKFFIAIFLFLASSTSFAEVILNGDLFISVHADDRSGEPHALMRLRQFQTKHMRVNSIHIGGAKTPALDIDINTVNLNGFGENNSLGNSVPRVESIIYDLGELSHIYTNLENAPNNWRSAKLIALADSSSYGCVSSSCKLVGFPIALDVSYGRDIRQKVSTTFYIRYEYGDVPPPIELKRVLPSPQTPLCSEAEKLSPHCH